MPFLPVSVEFLSLVLVQGIILGTLIVIILSFFLVVFGGLPNSTLDSSLSISIVYLTIVLILERFVWSLFR